MKKLITSFVMLMGVLTFQSCTSYRIKVVTHENNEKYYFPEQKKLLSWEEISGQCGATLNSAEETINNLKKANKPKVNYIYYGNKLL